MKIFTCRQIKEIDALTISREPISSVDLMERAAGELFRWITARYGVSRRMIVFAGPGNNGGDGLALARMLAISGYEVEAYYVEFSARTSGDWEINRSRLETETSVRLNIMTSEDQFPMVSSFDVVIDAIFGSGLTRASEGLARDIIARINNTGAEIISVDMPSGLFCEDNSANGMDGVIRAKYCLSFQFPKLAFMFPDNSAFCGEWEVLPIGLDREAVNNTSAPWIFLENSDIAPVIKSRNKFDHKGKFGHGLMVSGSLGKMGAAVMGAGAALRTGIGLVTCHIPSCGVPVIQGALPEAMVRIDSSHDIVSEVSDTDMFSAVAAGPGLGTDPLTQNALHALLSKCMKPMVLDADALNILSLNKHWLSMLPSETILTPHLREFERLAGKCGNGYERMMRQVEFSVKYNCIVVLKGAHSSVSTPDGRVFFNSTGNPGMATAGSGDVLTGMILSLLAQGYSPENAAVAGVYLHGLAGDIAAAGSSQESLIATDITGHIGKAFRKIRESSGRGEDIY